MTFEIQGHGAAEDRGGLTKVTRYFAQKGFRLWQRAPLALVLALAGGAIWDDLRGGVDWQKGLADAFELWRNPLAQWLFVGWVVVALFSIHWEKKSQERAQVASDEERWSAIETSMSVAMEGFRSDWRAILLEAQSDSDKLAARSREHLDRAANRVESATKPLLKHLARLNSLERIASARASLTEWMLPGDMDRYGFEDEILDLLQRPRPEGRLEEVEATMERLNRQRDRIFPEETRNRKTHVVRPPDAPQLVFRELPGDTRKRAFSLSDNKEFLAHLAKRTEAMKAAKARLLADLNAREAAWLNYDLRVDSPVNKDNG
jgi:hypothetical protein